MTQGQDGSTVHASSADDIVVSLPAAVFVCAADGRITFYNDAAARLWGRRPDAGERWCGAWRVFARDGTELAKDDTALARAVLRGEPLLTEEVIIERPDGRRRHVLPQPRLLFDADGALRGAVILVIDVSDRLQAETDQAVLAAIVTSSEDAIISMALDGTIASWNAGAERLFGYRAAEIVDQSVMRLVPPESAVDEARVLERVTRGERIGHYDAERLAADGRRLDVSVTVSPVFNAKGRIVGLSQVLRDISDRRTAQLELQRREEEFRAVVEHAPDIIARFDSEFRHIYVNAAITALTGLPSSEFVGRTSRELGMPPELCDQWESGIRDVFVNGKPGVLDFVFEGQQGEVCLHSRLVPEFGPDGSVQTVLSVVRDITDYYRARQEVQSVNETLEQHVAQRTAELRQLARQLVLAEQSERRRLSLLLHDDLQQLLVAACMRMDLLTERLRGSDHEQAVRRAMQLLQQSIDSSRSLSHELSPPILYDSGLCATLPWLAKIMLERHGLIVEVESDAEAEPHDEETRVSMFLSARELLFNVVKHADVHEARLELKRIDEHRIQLVVEDRGAGFDPDSVIGARQESFGLFSLRERIQFLGGQLQIVSRQGEGTRVTVELPLPEPTAEAPYELMPPSDHIEWSQPAGGHAAIRVLLADDHRILREGVVGILAEHADISVVAEAANGREALELARQHHPDVVVMDVTMPVLNGIEATRLISEQLPDVHIIGLTMHDSPDMAASMKEAGARDVLVKDGPSDALIAAIRTAAGRGQPHAG
jgi:PAS domain S-box-containing protein